MPYPYPSIWHTETPIPTPFPTLTKVVSEPSAPIDHTSPEAILNWVQYGLAHSDINVFADLTAPEIGYGPFASEYFGSYTKDEFISQLTIRLPNHPVCETYELREGKYRSLEIFVSNWSPPWEFDKFEGDFTGLVLIFTNQDDQNEELLLVGIGATNNIIQPLYEPQPCP